MKHITLTAEQKRAIGTDEKRVIVLGGPGTGKTHVQAAKIHDLVFIQKINPRHILVITQSAKSWRELESRLKKYLRTRVKDLWLGNLEKHCFHIVAAHARLIGYRDGVEVIPAEIARRRLHELDEAHERGAALPAHEIADVIAARKRSGLRADAREAKGAAEKYVQFLWRRYQDALRDENLLDPADLLQSTLALLREHPDIRAEYQALFRFIFIDDFQNLQPDALKMDVLRSLLIPEHSLFCTGDDDQAALERSGKPSPKAGILETIEGIVPFHLSQTMRLPPEILAPAQNLIRHNLARIDKVIWTRKEAGRALFAIKAHPTRTNEAAFAASTIFELARTDHQPWNDFAVLVRDMAASREVRGVFVSMRVPFTYIENRLYFEKTGVERLIGFLQAVGGPSLRTEHLPPFGEGCRMAQDERRRVLEEISVQRNSLAAMTVVRLAIEEFRVLDLPRDKEWPNDRFLENDVEPFLALVRSFEDISQDRSPAAFLRFLHIYRESGLPAQEKAVRILTVHQAKGLEFPVVFLPGLNEGGFPTHASMKRLEAMEEERRLFYIAMTRATEKLFITHSTMRGPFKLKDHSPSRFLHEILGV